LGTGLARTTVVTATATDISLSSNRVGDRDTSEVLKVQGLKELVGFRINLNNRGIQGRELGHKVVTTLTLFFLKLEGDTGNRTTGDTLHQMGGETSNLVAKTLGLNDGDLIKDLLVDLEIKSKTRIVLFNNDTRGLLDSLGSI
jgi:hypothetical protein